jgi:hypothetical protein
MSTVPERFNSISAPVAGPLLPDRFNSVSMPDWVRDGPATQYGKGAPFSTPAAYAASQGQRVPTYDGGTQLEWHRDGWDVEIEFDRDGVMQNVWIARATPPASSSADVTPHDTRKG